MQLLWLPLLSAPTWQPAMWLSFRCFRINPEILPLIDSLPPVSLHGEAGRKRPHVNDNLYHALVRSLLVTSFSLAIIRIFHFDRAASPSSLARVSTIGRALWQEARPALCLYCPVRVMVSKTHRLLHPPNSPDETYFYYFFWYLLC